MEKMIWKERWPRLELRRQREGLSHYPEHPELGGTALLSGCAGVVALGSMDDGDDVMMVMMRNHCSAQPPAHCKTIRGKVASM